MEAGPSERSNREEKGDEANDDLRRRYGAVAAGTFGASAGRGNEVWRPLTPEEAEEVIERARAFEQAEGYRRSTRSAAVPPAGQPCFLALATRPNLRTLTPQVSKHRVRRTRRQLWRRRALAGRLGHAPPQLSQESVVAGLVLTSFIACAGEPPVSPATNVDIAVVPGDDRVALVIGNGTYATIGRLRNPENDATDMSVALRRLGFEVTTTLNVGREELTEALRRFTRRSGGRMWR